MNTDALQVLADFLLSYEVDNKFDPSDIVSLDHEVAGDIRKLSDEDICEEMKRQLQVSDNDATTGVEGLLPVVFPEEWTYEVHRKNGGTWAILFPRLISSLCGKKDSFSPHTESRQDMQAYFQISRDDLWKIIGKSEGTAEDVAYVLERIAGNA